jgi:diguanylate cyclase (GGDEF)-like protein
LRNTPEPHLRPDTIRTVTVEARMALSSIEGYSAMLAEDLADSPAQVEDLRKISAASQRVVELIATLEELVDSAREQANRDPLTGVANRRTLFAHGEALFMSDMALSVLLIDVDKFKDVNDGYGHFVGDEVLRILVERCRRAVRDSDLVARLAGDEFVVLLPNTPLAEAQRVAERLANHVRGTPFSTARGELNISVSVGVAAREATDLTMQQLMARADESMYKVKGHR